MESLLAHDVSSETALGTAVSAAARSVEASQMEGLRIGHYRIVSLIGHGGMGSVYLAERADGEFDQRVALKVIRGGLDYGPAIERFRHERQVLARLTHPYIARLLDGGATADGSPYFVMEYVEGTPIHVHAAKLPIRQRVELFRLVCEAVRHAHQNLTVHRDLKPANILVTAKGEPKLLDFGIAKVLEKDATALAMTQTSAVALTPDYASPEQVRGEAITTATDVYSLGAVLYTMLTGQSPYEFKSAAPTEIERVVCVEEVRRPAALAREVRGDLEAIVLKAMRKEPAQRYRSVEQLSDDLGRYLDGRPVAAERNVFRYRAKKFIYRNRLLVSAATVVVLALAVGAGVAIWQARRAERRFQQVRGLAHSFLFDVEGSLQKVPGSIQSRQLIVRTSLSYLENLAQEATGDITLLREVASGYQKVGDIQGDPGGPNLGDTKGAAESYRKAQDLRRGFGADRSENAEMRREYLMGQVKVAYILEAMGSIDAAIALAREAVPDADRLAAVIPSDTDNLEVALTMRNCLGTLISRSGDLKGSLAERLRALELSRRIAVLRSNDIGAQRSLASALQGTGMTLQRVGDMAGAERYYREALGLYRGFAKADPTSLRDSRSVMILATLAGSAAFHQKHFEPAYELQKQAFDLAEAQLEADPRDARALMDDLAICQRFGDLLYEMKKVDEASRLYARALAYSERLVKLDPVNREANLNYALAIGRMATLEHKLGHLNSAITQRKRAADVLAPLAASAPKDTKVANPLMYNYGVLGEWLDEAGEREAAEPYHRKALEIGMAILAADPLEKEIRERLPKLQERLSAKSAAKKPQ